MIRYVLVLLAALACSPAHAQTGTVSWALRTTTNTTELGRYPTQSACDAAARASTQPGSTVLYECPRNYRVVGAVVCPAAPAATSATTTQACAADEVGGPVLTTITSTATVGGPPACTVTWTAGAPVATGTPCTPRPVEPPPPVATGTVLHFSDCQAGAAAGCAPGSNANPGTQTAPKQNLAGLNVNTLPAGSRLLFNRGGAWAAFSVRLENLNTTVAAPLTFDAYGSGPAPWLQVASGNMFNLGGGWMNTTNDGGYVIRNLKLDGMGTAQWGVWFVQNVRDVLIENSEVTGFGIGINSNAGTPHDVRGVTLRNNNINRNRAMGLLGHYNDLLIEGNLFEANNFSGSTFDHGSYLGGGNNITIRDNRYLRNSVVNGVCQGGNMTFHGQIDGMLIEGNTIEQDAAAEQCWLMSITQGYSSAEWFRNTVIRNNRLINGGNTVMAVQSAPGVLIEGNVTINTQATTQTSFAVGSGPGPYADGDDPDSGAIVRNNTACQSGGAAGSVVNLNSPGGTATGNTVITGPAATTGVCAR